MITAGYTNVMQCTIMDLMIYSGLITISAAMMITKRENSRARGEQVINGDVSMITR